MYVYCFHIKLKNQKFRSTEAHLSMNKYSEVMVVDNYEYIDIQNDLAIRMILNLQFYQIHS